ncbi:YycH family regulatory protein [Heyndrickxia ginsengihumi]|uniref:YycH family regulatory protein n=1 Tax=Heyndrickxia ginsengihumi TaxID=363870 RepID=UPI002040DC99|nr:two-component system activity regulator YycH [Heyndrickxia ginsengihumi]MCM3024137.1 two-component system activity regulator YycH [Heyndrickxia ginsengihumi]
MKLETIKTTILSVLVCLSIFLTWLIWNNQPSYEWLNLNDLSNISISKEKKVSQIVLPDKSVYHQNNMAYGTVQNGEVNRIMKELESWNFDIISTKRLSHNEINYLMMSNQRLVLEFPDDIPFNVYQNVFHFTNKKIPNANFDHIVVELKKGSKLVNRIYFISSKTNKVFEASTDQKKIQVFLTHLNQNLDVYDPYAAYTIKNNKKVFLPTNTPVMNQYNYAITDIEIDKFKKVLFRDPSFVKKVADEYTNGTSLLRTDDDHKVFSFVNPAENNELNHVDDHLFMKSIDFINQHSGWTDQFQYFEMNEKEHEVTFRLFKDGYPVFNEDGMADIQEYWGENEIYKYVRPYYLLSVDLPMKSNTVKLKSATQVISELKNDSSINMNNVEDIALGYSLKKDGDSSDILSFKPAWYYCYNGVWKVLGGGDKDGLE